ncbi:MAG: 2-phospho-L-lactate guanylyltransferase [Actinomycetota bacterium]
MEVAVVVPVKSFGLAKGRLADSLSADERRDLSRTCAETEVAAAAPWPVYVVCSDSETAQWAHSLGARVVLCEQPGLDTAVAAGRAAVRTDGLDHVVIAHADLPLARTFAGVPRAGRVSLVPDRHRDGTNVLSMPADSTMPTAYGPGSFANHLDLARASGLEIDVIDDPDLALDLDTVEDLDELSRRRHTP